MPVTQAYFDLIEAFAEPGCAVCRLALQDVHRFLDALLYEYTTDYDVYQMFRRSRGLCNFHTAQLAQYPGNAPGITVLVHGALDEVLKILDKSPVKAAGSAALRRLLSFQPEGDAEALANSLESAAPCAACEKLHDAEHRYLTILRDHPADKRLLTAYRNSPGLCLPHFRSLLRLAPAPEHLTLLMTTQKHIWTRLKSELETFLQKDGTQTADTGSEGDSRFRAMQALVGEKGVLKREDQ